MRKLFIAIAAAFLLATTAFAGEPEYPQPTAKCPVSTYHQVEAWNKNQGWTPKLLSKDEAVRVLEATGATDDVIAEVKADRARIHIAKKEGSEFVAVVVSLVANDCYVGAFPADPEAVAKALVGQGA